MLKTMLEVYQALPEGAPVQLINNKIIMSPSPNYPHFETVDYLIRKLRRLRIGKVLYAPLDVHLDEKNVVQPDVFVIDDLKMIQENGIHGVPAIMVEVLSTKRSMDLKVKRDLYEMFGVKEYFVVDPKTKAVKSYYLNDKHMFEEAQEIGVLISRQFNFTIKL